MIVKIPSVDGASHSIDTRLLFPGGWVLDAGCRGFDFARAMRDLGCNVLAMDPAEDVECPEELKFGTATVRFVRIALMHYAGQFAFVPQDDPMAGYVAEYDSVSPAWSKTALGLDIPTVMKFLGITRFEAIKLDIEGAEYPVCRAWPGPIAVQVSIEWHGDAESKAKAWAIDRLGMWYRCVKDDKLDSLFVLR